MQGDDPDYLKVAACAKHFAVHSGPEDQRHYFNAVVSKQDLWETYLPAFKALVEEAGVEAVMGAYNRTNGEPCCGSKTLLRDILRGKWHFDGHVTSDCWAIKDFHEGHMVTEGPVDSVALAVNNGCDLNCGNLYVYLEQAVAEGKVDEKTIDESVVRLFTTRFKLGMFDPEDKVPYNRIDHTQVDSPAMQELNLRVAEKILVLLKNKDNILPLDANALKTIAVVGPNADNRKALVGNYEGTASRYFTVLDGLHEYLGDKVEIRYSQGCHLYADKIHSLSQEGELISEVKGMCAESDVVICCLGLDSGLEGEEGDQGNQFASGDKPNLNLPGHQEEILRVCLDSGKPVIVVVLSGSALAINTAENEAAAVLQAWYPGAMGGLAVARALFGEVNPQGKLPVTFYHSDEDLPSFTDYAMKGRTYRYMEKEALYPFGYGLSYTRFAFKDAALSAQTAGPDGVDLSVTVRNEGSRAGIETVQVYVKAERPGTPNAQLKGLAKVDLAPGEEHRVTLHLPLEALALCNEEGVCEVLPGDYTLWVGGSQPDARSITLAGQAPLRLALRQVEKVVMDD